MNLARLSVRELETEARNVEAQLSRLQHRPRPTPSERQLSIELKKMRLQFKDRIATLKR